MNFQHFLITVTILSLSTLISGYPYFQAEIPNGDNVQHPCFVNKIWKGVGHFNQYGGGLPNPFGVDFKNAGKKWTRALCMKDSDGDGKTNGEELGDPTCIWSKGNVPMRTKNITHPGVCQPLTSQLCKTKNKPGWDICLTDKFVCNDIHEPNVTALTLRLKYTKVPKKVTNYYCQAFALPATIDYHMIAVEPVINNTNVMHHILLFGCNSKPADKHFLNAYPCGMGGHGCSDIIAGWTLGSNGDCFKNHSGVRIGIKGYKFAVLQVHWNNPEMRSDYMDSSGLNLYLTTKLRGNDSGVLTIGQRYLEIPPGKSTFVEIANCSSKCTERHLPHPIYLASIIPHMHNAGRYSQITLYRNGKVIRDLFPYSPVRYDDPHIIDLNPPAELRPGDKLFMKCVYKTIIHKNILYYGDATADEMCFGFFRYFPAQQKLKRCIDYGPIDTCTVSDPENGGDGKYLVGRIGKCESVGKFMVAAVPYIWKPQIDEHCDISNDVCRANCKAVVMKLNQDPCWQGWARKYIEYLSMYYPPLREFRLAIMPCSNEIENEARMKMLMEANKNKSRTDPKFENKSTNNGEIILIIVGSVVAALLLICVAAVGLYRAFIYRPKQSPSPKHLINSGITSEVDNGFDNIAAIQSDRI